MLKRRTICFLLSLTVISMASVLPAAEKLRFATTVKGNPYHELPALAAQEQGFWKQNGLEVEWLDFRSGQEGNQAMAGKSVDLVQNGTIVILQAVAAGLPAIIVADYGRDDFFLWVRADSTIKEPKDLKGARIGIVRIGGVPHAYARAVTKALGLEREVKFVAGGGLREELALMVAGKLDARFAGYTTFAKAKYDGLVRDLFSIQDYLPKEWTDINLTVLKGFMHSQPETLRRAVKAYLLATQFVRDNRDWTTEKLKSVYSFSDEGARGMYQYQAMRYSRDGRIDPKAVENVRNFLIEYGILAAEKVPPAKELHTNEFVR